MSEEFSEIEAAGISNLQVLSDGHLVIVWGETDNPISELLPTGYEPLCRAIGTAFSTSADYANNLVPLAYVDTAASLPVLFLEPAGGEMYFTIIYPIAQ